MKHSGNGWFCFLLNIKNCIFQSFLFWFSGVATVITSVVGVVGNCLSILVLSTKVRFASGYLSAAYHKHFFKERIMFFLNYQTTNANVQRDQEGFPNCWIFQSMSSVFHHLLAFLCLADLLFVFFSLLMSPLALHIPYLYSRQFYPIAECVCNVALAARIYLTTSLNIERKQVWEKE